MCCDLTVLIYFVFVINGCDSGYSGWTNNMQFLYNHNILMTMDVFGSLHCR